MKHLSRGRYRISFDVTEEEVPGLEEYAKAWKQNPSECIKDITMGFFGVRDNYEKTGYPLKSLQTDA